MAGVRGGRGEKTVGQRIPSVSHGSWRNSASCSGIENTSDHEQVAPASMLATIIAIS